jgi:di/tricarboxylate transporter
MAGYWLTEALPLPITGFLPLVIFPMMGVAGVKDLAKHYIKVRQVKLFWTYSINKKKNTFVLCIFGVIFHSILYVNLVSTFPVYF